MARITHERTINAPLELVFQAIGSAEEFAKVIPDVVKIEFLSNVHSGVGTKFRETRIMKGKEAATELEVTEYVENERIRLVSDTFGTIWDSVFTVSHEGDATKLTLTMDAEPQSLTAKLSLPMMKGMISKALEQDMDTVKMHCEAAAAD